MRSDKAQELRVAIKLSAQNATDVQALSMRSLYDDWNAGVSYGGQDEVQIVRRPNGLYRVRQPHVSQLGWEPENYPAGWKYIDIVHAGTREDPIPAAVNMEYFEGKFYSENGNLYLCIRDSLDAVAYLPSELVGQYFEVV